MPCRLLVTIFEKTGSAVGSTKDKCIVKQRISKHVYALPNKPQSAKSKGVNIESPVYSWPHIYFVVDDFEDMLEDVRLQPNEYVLIELSTYIRTKQRHAHKKIRKSPKSWLASGAESREKYELKRKNNLPVFGRQKHLNRQENDSNIVEKEVVLFKGATSYETLVGMYTQKHNNGNLISKLRNTSYSTEFLVLQDPRRTSCTQIALKGGKNSPNLCSKVFDFEDKLGLRYSHSNPALRNLTKPPNSPQPCIELVLKSSEQLHCPQPIRPIKSPQFSHLITTSPLRRHSSNLHPHQSSLQIEKSLSTYHQPGSPHDKNNLYFFTSCLTDSVLVCNETSRRNDSNPLSKWLQRLTSPFMFDSYARPSSADQRSSNSPESLHFFINHISIHWSDIVNDIFDAKRQVDHY
ncbi:hypothetical protein AX774_g749 [Zancudomyces culisetae]|uniref:Uncharacterized protein n=1 Tax=Zancudomyces culisetae TaxID=1213189 RepID=A0A1R1PXQ9_ZANCU|nr:hypothetical protein AX774_g749 [Zancudomyces culisetae]|eukprot:OMH85698.1 hypothetical protein AX774_g749 [Zancudomyces culisetae]